MRFTRIAALAAVLLSVVACSEPSSTANNSGASSAPRIQDIPKSQPVSFDAIKKVARGFDAGSVMSQRHVYVFFDPQCPHCGRLWDATKELRSTVRFTWVPVAYMRAVSSKQGAALLGAAKPADMMDVHESLLSSGKGGISVEEPSDELDTAVQRNTKLLMSFGIKGIPFVVGAHAQTGELVSFKGYVEPEQLSAALGWAAGASEHEPKSAVK